MNSFFDSGPLPDWKDIQQLLGKDIPWKLAANWDAKGDSNWINQYVKDILQKSKSDARIKAQNSVQMETKQDAKFVSVSIRLTPDTDLRKLQLFASSERLRVAGLPGDQKKAVRLPCSVFARSGKATMKKDRVLVVKFKRRPPEKSEYELFIQS